MTAAGKESAEKKRRKIEDPPTSAQRLDCIQLLVTSTWTYLKQKKGQSGKVQNIKDEKTTSFQTWVAD